VSGRILLVTGTGTGVGKTVVTAAIASLAAKAGKRVAVVKPGQTGVDGDDIGDVDDIKRLSGVSNIRELVRYPDPIAPAAAARISGKPTLVMREAGDQVKALAENNDLVLVEGAGGLLVEYNPERETMADLATLTGADVLVAVLPNLGTLNQTALTLEAIEHRNLPLAGVVIGRWPKQPGMICENNIVDLETIAKRPLSGAIRERAAHLSKPEFLAAADAGLAPAFGGHFDAADFRQRFEYRRKA
jgi:dethiobiotin synthetase